MGIATVYLPDDLPHDRKLALEVFEPELAAVVGAERLVAEIKATAFGVSLTGGATRIDSPARFIR